MPEFLDVGIENRQGLGQFLLHFGMCTVISQRVKERLHGVSQGIERSGKVRQRVNCFAVFVLDTEAARAFIKSAKTVARNEIEVLLGLAAVEPDNGKQVLLLLRTKIIDLAGNLAIDVARVDH